MSKFGFDKMPSLMKQNIKTAVSKMAHHTVKYFGDSFSKQGIGGEKWDEVQRRIPGTPAFMSENIWGHTRPPLYGTTGNLRSETKNGLKIITDRSFTIENNPPYAAIQNYGGVNGRGGNVPARPFIKQTNELTQDLS